MWYGTGVEEAVMEEANAPDRLRSFVADVHVHSADFLPGYAARLYRWFLRRTVPPDVDFDELTAAGVDAVVANAVGDRLVTVWWGRPRWSAVRTQLRRIRAHAEEAQGLVATTAQQVRQARRSGHT